MTNPKSSTFFKSSGIRSLAFKIGHFIAKCKDLFRIESWSKCLKVGWLLAKLHSGIKTKVCFAKDGGEIRNAVATISLSLLKTIENGYVRFVESIGDDKTQIRSFRIERLVF